MSANQRPASHQKYERLVAAAQEFPALATAVAYPCDTASLEGAVEAADAGLILPILVGPRKKIMEVARRIGADIGGFRNVFHGGVAESSGTEELNRGAYDSLTNLKFPAIASVWGGHSLGRE